MNISDLFKQARQFQERLGTLQEELAAKTVTGSAGGGMVQVTVNGNGELVGLTIEKEIVDRENVAMLQDLILAAANDGIRKAKELARSEMASLTGGVNLPGMV